MSTRVNQSGYSAPRLVTYGDVREITQAVGNMGNEDGGAGATSKTQP
jgi:hypothetical protein